MKLMFCSVFVILVSIFISSHGLLEVFETCWKKNYTRDQAIVTFINNMRTPRVILTRSQECWNCSLLKIATVQANSNVSLNFSTVFIIDVVVKNERNVSVCNISLELQEGNEYDINENDSFCNIISKCPDLPDPNIPVYGLIGSLIAFVFLWEACLVLKRRGATLTLEKIKTKILKRARLFSIKSLDNSDVDSQESTTDLIQADLGNIGRNLQKNRIHSIDAFRGFSLVVMIFVNYGGGGYWFFHHSSWDGVTVADLPFPWFVFIMGMTAEVSFHLSRKKKLGKLQMLFGIVKRSFFLFCLGLMLSNKNRTFINIRIPGVLQRLAITFLIIGAVETFEISLPQVHHRKFGSYFRDILPFWRSWIVVVVCVLVHTCLTFFLPVPGCPISYLGAGGLQDLGEYKNCTGGAAGYIDRMVFGQDHIYQHPTCMHIYKTKVPFDPEGILGTLTSVVTCFFGVQAGRILLSYEAHGKMRRWFIWAVVLGLAGGGLCGFKKFGGLIPLNKNLWSLSFVFVMSSMALILFSIFYLLIDCLEVWSGAPFIYPGMNSIAVYMGSEILENYFPLHLFESDSHTGLTLVNSWGVLFWIIVSAVMHSKNIFIAL